MPRRPSASQRTARTRSSGCASLSGNAVAPASTQRSTNSRSSKVVSTSTCNAGWAAFRPRVASTPSITCMRTSSTATSNGSPPQPRRRPPRATPGHCRRRSLRCRPRSRAAPGRSTRSQPGDRAMVPALTTRRKPRRRPLRSARRAATRCRGTSVWRVWAGAWAPTSAPVSTLRPSPIVGAIRPSHGAAPGRPRPCRPPRPAPAPTRA